MTDTVQVTVTFTRELLVNGLPRNFTASLTFAYEEYVAMKAEDVEALKLAKVQNYVTAAESEKPDTSEMQREMRRIEEKIANFESAKVTAVTADAEISKLQAALYELSK